MSGPADALVAPSPEQPVPPAAMEFINFADWISPSHIVFEGLQWITGLDPLGWVSEQFSGEWQAFAAAGEALEHLGTFSASSSDALDDAARALARAWTGEAATAAQAYLTSLKEAIADQEAPLRAASAEFETLSDGMFFNAAAVTSLMEAICDAALYFMLNTAAATAAAASILGLPASLALAALAASNLAKGIKLWMQVIQIHGIVVGVVNGFVGAMAGYLGTLGKVAAVPLPGGYDNPQV